MNHFNLLPALLSLFSEGGGEGGAAAAAFGSASGDTNLATAAVTQPQKNDLKNVRYGKQDPDDSSPGTSDVPPAAGGEDKTGVNQTSDDTPEARQREFDELINSERYKDLYTKRTQALIDRRFSETRVMETEITKLREIAELAGKKYGITDDADFSKLKAAIEGDEETWSREADEAGMSIEQYKKFDAIRRENAAYKAAEKNDVIAAQQRQKAQRWMNEAQALKAKFPAFDLKLELSDPNFVAAMNAGVPMELVYKGKYYDQNLEESSRGAAKAAERRAVDNVRARGSRPSENGTSSQSSSFTVKSDPSKLTLDDFNEIARRVRNGERISY